MDGRQASCRRGGTHGQAHRGTGQRDRTDSFGFYLFAYFYGFKAQLLFCPVFLMYQRYAVKDSIHTSFLFKLIQK